MKRFQSIAATGLLLCTLLLTPGCMLALLEAKRVETRAQLTQGYSEYRIEMEKINLEREKAGLPPQPILTYEEWNKSERR